MFKGRDVRRSEYKELYHLLRAKLGSPGPSSVAEDRGASLEQVLANPHVRSMLQRIGLASPARPAAVADAVRKIAHAVGEPDEAVAATLLRYAAGPDGDGRQAVCGPEPRCRECPPKIQCRHRTPHATIKSLPEDQRPRERLIHGGEDQLSDPELLAIIIRDGTPEASALQLAHALVGKYKTFRRLSAASLADLCAIKGIGPAKAAQIKAALAIARRLEGDKLPPGEKFGGSHDVFQYFSERLRDEKKETFWTVLLDQKNHIIKVDRVSVGSLVESLVHPREVFRNAIRESAASILFVHNHPSGDPQPSQEDIEVTKKLVQTGQIVGIQVLDHVIIAGEEFLSLKGQGLM